MADTQDERLRYLIGRLGAHADSAMVAVDGGRIEELCHLILHEIGPRHPAFTTEDIVNEAVRIMESPRAPLNVMRPGKPAAGWHP